MADPDNSGGDLFEIPEVCSVCATAKDTQANRRGITWTKANRLFPLQGKDAVHNDLATVAPEGQWAHRMSVQTLDTGGTALKHWLGTPLSCVFALKIAPHKSLNKILFRATCTFFFPVSWKTNMRTEQRIFLLLFVLNLLFYYPWIFFLVVLSSIYLILAVNSWQEWCFHKFHCIYWATHVFICRADYYCCCDDCNSQVCRIKQSE